MGDLEAEHDYLLDREVEGRRGAEGAELTRPALSGEGAVASRLVTRPALCSLLPDPGPCGSQVARHSDSKINR